MQTLEASDKYHEESLTISYNVHREGERCFEE